MLRNTIARILKGKGYEICRLNPNESQDPLAESFNYKEFQVIRGLSAPSQLSLDEARFLAELVHHSDRERPIIEIGTLFGWSTLVMTLEKATEQRLITVDNYSWNPLGLSPDAHYMATKRALVEAVAKYNVEQVRMDKNAFYESYSGSRPTLFFCDANHSYEETLRDLKWARAIGVDVICGDDYHPQNFPGVARAVAEMGGPRMLVDELFVL
jgi:hypothetical protein